jgi:hypothetical protein
MVSAQGLEPWTLKSERQLASQLLPGSAMKLNKATVGRLGLPNDVQEKIFVDETLPGFGLRIRAGGKQTWIAQYRLGFMTK